MERRIKILITEMGCLKNKGNYSILKGTIKAFTKYFPNAEFVVMTHGPKEEIKEFEIKAVPSISKVPLHPSMTVRMFETILGISKLFAAMIFASFLEISVSQKQQSILTEKISQLKEYASADLIVVRGSDTLTDRYGMFGLDSLLMRCFGILIGVLMKKPTVICGHSIGPFNTRFSRFLARFVFDRVSLITVRENISKENLKKLNVENPNIFETADLAFLVEPAPPNRAKEILTEEKVPLDKPLVGISVSRLIADYIQMKPRKRAYATYIEFMAEITDFIVETFNVTVVFIPHVVGPGKKYDDRLVSKDVYRLVKTKDRAKEITGDYSPEELRSLIGNFEIFVGARMHAVISALSMHVPSLVFAYLPKAQGIMKTVGQEEYVYNIERLNYEEVTEKISKLWENRENIRKQLRERMKNVREKSFLNAKLAFYLVKPIRG